MIRMGLGLLKSLLISSRRLHQGDTQLSQQLYITAGRGANTVRVSANDRLHSNLSPAGTG